MDAAKLNKLVRLAENFEKEASEPAPLFWLLKTARSIKSSDDLEKLLAKMDEAQAKVINDAELAMQTLRQTIRSIESAIEDSGEEQWQELDELARNADPAFAGNSKGVAVAALKVLHQAANEVSKTLKGNTFTSPIFGPPATIQNWSRAVIPSLNEVLPSLTNASWEAIAIILSYITARGLKQLQKAWDKAGYFIHLFPALRRFQPQLRQLLKLKHTQDKRIRSRIGPKTTTPQITTPFSTEPLGLPASSRYGLQKKAQVSALRMILNVLRAAGALVKASKNYAPPEAQKSINTAYNLSRVFYSNAKKYGLSAKHVDKYYTAINDNVGNFERLVANVPYLAEETKQLTDALATMGSPGPMWERGIAPTAPRQPAAKPKPAPKAPAEPETVARTVPVRPTQAPGAPPSSSPLALPTQQLERERLQGRGLPPGATLTYPTR